jgi:uncharacterized membrane protein HdeD (DUF308 family)
MGAPTESELNLVRKSWPLLLALGVVMTILGVLAIASPWLFTPIVVWIVGISLILGGATQLVSAFITRCWRSVFVHLLIGILYLVLGLGLIRDPERGARVLTLIIMAGFLIGGLFRIVVSLGSDRFPGWGWVLGNGIVTLVMGALIWAGWPESANWVLGLFVGIELFSAGGTWVALALALRKAPPATA